MTDYNAEKVSRTDCAPWRDEETLRHFYHDKGYSLLETAEAVGCTEGTISQWCDRLGVETRDAQEARDAGTPEELEDREWLRREYRDKERTCAEIAEELDVTDLTVSNWLRRHDIPTRSANARRDRVTLSCHNCGDEFETVASREDRAKYCSRECYYGDMDMPTGEDHWSYNSADIECGWCGETFTVPGSRRQEREYCSRECFQSDHEFPSGEAHPSWKETPEYRPSGKEWQDLRERVRERDGYECQLCGVHEDDMDRTLDVHHLDRVRDADDPRAAVNADESRLVSLCRSCHRRAEPYAPLLPPAE